MESQPLNFIDEPIEVFFDTPPALEKAPSCPSGFIWRAETYHITEMLETWVDFTRRGRFARNMTPAHRRTAARRGSWGVGRYHFRVRVQDGRLYHIYYDRAPESAADRKGRWFLLGERSARVE